MADGTERGTVAQRIASVQAQAERLEMDEAKITGGKANYSYKFLSESTMFEWLAPRLLEAGIATSPPRAHVTHRDGNLVEVEVEVDFINIDDEDDKLTGVMPAQATDQGDKALAKAITSAVRYLYWKTFRFPAEDPAADAERSAQPHETAADRRAAQLLGEARELAKKKGASGNFEAAIQGHLKETGLVVPHPDFVRPLIEQLKGMPDQLAPDPGSTPAAGDATAEKPAEGALAAAPRKAMERAAQAVSGDPFGVFDGKEPAVADAGMSEDTAGKVRDVMNGLVAVREDVDWMAKLTDRCQEWYGKSDWQTLTDDQGKDLATKLEATRLELVKRIAAGQ